jgi:hypothetical protein
MAGSNRRFTFAAIALPLLFVVMSGLARANDIFVNTTDGENPLAPLCSLPDAITAHNITTPVHGCAAGDGDDKIFFLVTGTILIDEPLEIAPSSGTLSINGPIFGCSGAGPCGITIDGGATVQIIRADSGTTVILNSLTLNHGFATSGSMIDTGGGAVYADGTDLEVNDCLFINNLAEGSGLALDSSSPAVLLGLGTGGAIYGASGSINIVNSTFSNNTAESGLILCADSAAVCSAPLMVVGSEGGAIFNSGSVLKITNSTIANNTADAGAGVFNNYSSWSSKSTILAHNVVGNCGGTNPTDVGYNISDDTTCGFSGTSAIMLDPLLDPAGPLNNGGPTDTIALEPTSPAIDRIPIANCTDQQAIPQPVETDQRLFGRPDPANLDACDSGAYEIEAVAPIMLAAGTEKVQIARNPTVPNTDKVNIGLTFIYKGDPDCDLGPYGDEDALNHGFGIALVEGTCASLPPSGLFVLLEPFVVHTVNHESYGTLFQVNGPEQVSARLLALPTPLGTCGEWTLNLEVSGLNTPALGLGGGNPFAILISDLDDAEQCFDVDNAIVGTQIPTPAPHSTRRRIRRQGRR